MASCLRDEPIGEVRAAFLLVFVFGLLELADVAGGGDTGASVDGVDSEMESFD